MKRSPNPFRQQATERLAAHIAGRIIKAKQMIVGNLNYRVNRLSNAGKLWLLIAGCLVTALMILACRSLPFSAITASPRTYVPQHIGSPSVMPLPEHPIMNDTLTLKK